MVEYTIYSCPKCDCFIDLVIYGLSSRIGPSFGICSKCEGRINTGRKEWDEMNLKEKAKFFSVTALYILFVGAAGWLFTIGAYKFLAEGWGAKGLDFGANSFVLMFLWASSVLFIQCLRINASKKRFLDKQNFVLIGFPSLTFGLQIIYLLLMIIPFALGGIIGYLRG